MQGLKYTNETKGEILPINGYLKIPVDLCAYAIRLKLTKPFKLYILLASITQGNVVLGLSDQIAISRYLGYSSIKSVSNNLSLLIKIGWLGYDVNRKKYWIRGFDELRSKHDLKSRKAVEFGLEFINDFEAFCFAAVIGKLLIYQGWRRRLARMKSGRAFHDLPSKPGYFPVANLYIKRLLGLSLSSGSRYKKLAIEAGFMERMSTLITVPIKPEELGVFKSYDGETFGRMYIKGNRVVEPGVDLLKVFLTYRRRKKFDT